MSGTLYFLKLGGSLITDKQQPHTFLPDVLRRLVAEIAASLAANPDLQLVLGHGSGSFGHIPAKEHSTRQGVRTPEEWLGFAEVWREAAALNHHVMDALHATGLRGIAFPPSASVIGFDGKVSSWDLEPLQAALDAGLLPVVFGDVVFDRLLGGTILSTEDLFAHLARQLHPQRLLLAGIEPWVWADYPDCTRPIERITPQMLEEFAPTLRGSAAPDVTGGMYSKVTEMMALVEALPGLEVFIFSGNQEGNVKKALSGKRVGTVLKDANSE